MPSFELTAVESRVLGSLIEKERVTPENYPLSLNSVTLACNQSTNREPVTAYDEKAIEAALNSLRTKKLATVIFGAGARVQKYRHNLLDHFELDRRDVALLCVLLLRGPQTPGELRSRSERLCPFASVDEVEACLAELAKGEAPLVRILPARPGQKERRYIQLLSVEGSFEEPAAAFAPAPVLTGESRSETPSRMETMEKEVAALKAEVVELREAFAAFRKQFE